MNYKKKTVPKIATKAMIEQLFDDAADTYDQAGPSLFTRFGARLVEHMPITPGMTVLDVATGKGAAVLPCARKVGPDGRVAGVDLSATILQEADRAVCAAGLANVEFRRMDAERLEFPDGAFDAITCAFSLFLFPDLDAALREMYRVCKPGGYVGVSLFDKTPPPFDPGWPVLLKQFVAYGRGVVMPQQVAYAPQEVEALLTGAGFGPVSTHRETNDIVFAALEAWWEFQFTVGTRLSIESMDEETLRRFKDEYMEKLRPLLAPDGFHVSLGVVYAVARR
jgi:O-methyltransferase / aklanonic acid methyltransferase